MSRPSYKEIIRALLLVADSPLSVRKLEHVLVNEAETSSVKIRAALRELQEELQSSSLELIEVASGFRLQVRKELAPWVGRLYEEKPQKYSRAFLETLALICYRQPLTRGDIEEIRGVSLSGGILKTLFEREWVREVGHREGPGRPALLATTRQLLDDLNLKSLEDLPSLPELSDPEKLEAALVRLAPQDELPQALKDQLQANAKALAESQEAASTEHPADEEEKHKTESEFTPPDSETTRH
ncbi:MAG: SMC-Scp complex subunit ScpB [Oceanococcus sp.]